MAEDNNTAGSPFLRELKKQTSSFLKEKLQSARLVLTDATRAQLLAEKVTGGNLRCPDTRTMAVISKAAFEIDDFWRVADVLHKRFSRFDRKHWRESYNSLTLLEHLLVHGPKSYSDEFQIDREVIREIASVPHIDETGFNWGLAARKKSERVLKLLEKGPELCEERERARRLAHTIRLGSFSETSSFPVKSVSRKSDFSIQYIDGDGSGSSSSRRDVALPNHEEKENSNSKVLVSLKSKTENQGEVLNESSSNSKALSSSIRKRFKGAPVNSNLQEESKPLLSCRSERRSTRWSWKPALFSGTQVSFV